MAHVSGSGCPKKAYQIGIIADGTYIITQNPIGTPNNHAVADAWRFSWFAYISNDSLEYWHTESINLMEIIHLFFQK